MIKSRVLMLLGLFLALGVSLVYLRHQDDEIYQEKVDKRAEKKFLRLQSEKITSITLNRKNQSIHLNHDKISDGWTVGQKPAFPADKDIITTIIHALQHLSYKSVLPESASKDLALFGLKTPRLKAIIETESAKKVFLLLGKGNSFDGSIYVKTEDSNKVYVVQSSLEYQLDKDVYDLRSKIVNSFSAEDIDTIQIDNKHDKFIIEQGDPPELIAPKQARANKSQVEGLLAAMKNAKVKAFSLPNDAFDTNLLKRPPQIKVTLLMKDVSKKPLEFPIWQINTKTKKMLLISKHPSTKEMILLFDDGIFQKLDLRYEVIRDARLFHFDRTLVKRLTLSANDEALDFTKVKEPNSEHWKWKLGEKRAKGSSIEGIVYLIMQLEGMNFIKEPWSPELQEKLGLDRPAISIKAETDTGELIFNLISFAGKDKFLTVNTVEKKAAQSNAAELHAISLNPDNYLEPIEAAEKN
ncbi:MAG: DUF4340 domain-containing protein [Myxococcota bacterium]|nr:DUF4340 domain-containing protein [Myxococcota bacterium]